MTNGLGNLIIGWNEYTDGAIRTGSHNLVIGPFHSYTSYGGLVAGVHNTISGGNSSVTGGQLNSALGGGSSVTGGFGNRATGDTSSVTGGRLNNAGRSDTVVGGDDVTCFSSDADSVCGEGSLSPTD